MACENEGEWCFIYRGSIWVEVCKMGFTLCKKNEITFVARTGVIGYQYLGNRLPTLKMVLEVL